MGYSDVERRINEDIRLERAQAVVRKLRSGYREQKIGFIETARRVLSTGADKANYEDEVGLLKQLSEFNDLMDPRWRVDYNVLQEKRGKFGNGQPVIRTDSTLGLLEDAIDTEEDNLTIVALNMYLSNKLAHVYGVARDRLTEAVLKTNNLNADTKSVSADIKKYYQKKYQKNEKAEMEYKKKLLARGITDDVLAQCESMGIAELVTAELHAFSIKDRSMLMLFTRAKNREMKKEKDLDEPISFGMVSSESGPLLVVDLPYFGQFSVHMREKYLISALSENEYSRSIYSLETVMLSERMAPEAISDVKIAGRLTDLEGISYVEAVRRMARKRIDIEGTCVPEARDKKALEYAHHLLVKSGKGKKELDELYDEK